MMIDEHSTPSERGSAVIVGVGPGLGAALARRFAGDGLPVAIVSRDPAGMASLRDELAQRAPTRLLACDATEPEQVEALLDEVERNLAPPEVLVYNAGAFVRREVLETTPDQFVSCWKVGCFGGFLVARAAGRGMVERGRGTILFTGATASLRGSAGFVNLAVGKFGLRALAQSLARELGPKGVHVAHVVIDGQIDSPRYAELAAGRPPDGLLSPDAIAAEYARLHAQHRSAWTFELDLRPWVERF